jgi:hypothetical protein
MIMNNTNIRSSMPSYGKVDAWGFEPIYEHGSLKMAMETARVKAAMNKPKVEKEKVKKFHGRAQKSVFALTGHVKGQADKKGKRIWDETGHCWYTNETVTEKLVGNTKEQAQLIGMQKREEKLKAETQAREEEARRKENEKRLRSEPKPRLVDKTKEKPREKSNREKPSDSQSVSNTRMCSSIVAKKKCKHGAKCRFAHSIDQLEISECSFGARCKHVGRQGNVYVNKSERACQYMHPGETKKDVFERTK